MQKIKFAGLKVIGKYTDAFNQVLGVDYPVGSICYSKGLEAHIKKQNHYNVLKYLQRIHEMIAQPDYIGVNPHEYGCDTIEVVKHFDEYVMIGLKWDKNQEYYYVTTMYTLQPSKVKRRCHSGRLRCAQAVHVPASEKRKEVYFSEHISYCYTEERSQTI